jgi:hypothetical protein
VARASADLGASGRPAMPLADIARLRLQIQGVTAPRFTTPAEAVAWLGAVQSQEYGYAKWSLGQRSTGVDEAAVDRALAEGSILRTHLLRPTWHYVRRQDIRWMLTATARRVRGMMAPYDRPLELDEGVYARSNELIVRALEGENHLTRAALSEALSAGGIEAKGQRLGHLVMRAELDALICSGVPQGKQLTYALVSERAPDAIVLGPDAALAELTRRYFTGHGPATEKDFRWWATLTAGEARRGLQIVGEELERWTVDELTFFWVPVDPAAAPEPQTAHLLQIYDECIVGYTESRKLLDVGGSAWATGVATPYPHVLLLDGQLAGRWRRQIRAAEIVVEVQPSRRLRRGERSALQREVESYGRFAGVPARLDL